MRAAEAPELRSGTPKKGYEVPEKPENGLSRRAFAEKAGCSEGLVRRALKLGDLHLNAAGLLDASLLRTNWRRSAQRGMEPPTRVRQPARAADGDAQPIRTKHPDRRTKAIDRIPTAALTAPPGGLPPPGLTFSDFKDMVARGEAPDLGSSERLKNAVAAANRLMDMEERAGRLLDAEEAAQLAFQMTRAFRDGLITWAARMGPQLAQEFGLDAAVFSQRLKGAVNDLLQSARATEAEE